MQIAIDGPSGAGKSTIARKIANAIGFTYVDTGAIYRAVGLATLQTPDEPIETLLPKLTVKLEYQNNEQQIYLNYQNITTKIRTPEVSMAASNVSKLPCVRDFLLQLQRDLAAENNVIMDGRDIGTVVLPEAEIKIFLTADPADRANRRYQELKPNNPELTYESVLNDVIKRDTQDQQRAASPLKPAKDAIIVDTTGNELEKSIEIITEIIKSNLPPTHPIPTLFR